LRIVSLGTSGYFLKYASKTSASALLSEIVWYNTDLVKPGEIRSLDDFLNPKWKGKIGYLK
jgi:ABC-type Fe3+ transport system substrate-binding protein